MSQTRQNQKSALRHNWLIQIIPPVVKFKAVKL